MKRKEAGLQAKIQRINTKALFLPYSNCSLKLAVDSAKSYTKAFLVCDMLTQLYTLFSSSTQGWAIL